MTQDERTTSRDGVSRRTVVGTAAWAAPTIVMAAAAPSFAASPVGFRFNPGQTAGARYTGFGQSTPALNSKGGSVTALGSSIAVGQLTLVVAANDASTGAALAPAYRTPTGWTAALSNGKVLYTNAVAVAQNASIATFPNVGNDAVYVAVTGSANDVVFTLTFTYAGESASFTYSTVGGATVGDRHARNAAEQLGWATPAG